MYVRETEKEREEKEVENGDECGERQIVPSIEGKASMVFIIVKVNTKRIKGSDSNRYLYTNVQSSIIHKSQKVKTTQIGPSTEN